MQGILGGLRPAVVAMIASAGLSLLVLAVWNGQPASWDLGQIDPVSVVLFIAGLIVLRIKKSDPILVMAAAGVAGLIAYSVI